MAGHIKKREGVTAKGKKYVKFRARFPDPLGGGTKQIERTFKTEDEANAWLDEQRHAARSGGYINKQDGARSFALVAEEYRNTWADLEPRTKVSYAHILRKHLLPRFGQAKISAVTTDAVQRFVNDLAQTHAPNTVRRIYGVLRSVLKVAMQRRYIAANPCDAVRLPKLRQANGDADERMLFLLPAEVRVLAEAMPEHYRVATYVAAYCGLRAGELWALRRKDVDLLRGVLHVRQALKEINGQDADDIRGMVFGAPKSSASRRAVALPAPIRQLLAEHLNGPAGNARTKAGYVYADPARNGPAFTEHASDPRRLLFSTPGGNLVRHGQFYQRVFQPAVRAALPHYADYANKRGLRWHDLRHTCASLSLAVPGAGLHVVKERLGHTDIRMTINTYGHLLPSVEAALADGLGEMFAAAGADPTAADTTAPDAPLDNLRELHG